MEKRFCSNCGSEIQEGTRFCSNCGADSQPVVTVQPVQPVQTVPSAPVYTNPAAMYIPQKRKTPVVLIVVIAAIVLGILITGAIFLIKYFKSRDPRQTSTPTSSQTISTVAQDTAVVSRGVRVSDLGNILNGQYYFATDDMIFYSSFDTSDKAHIYAANRDGGNLHSIFDGFGWSLVVIDDWLYFSGNQGDAIDGTYNIFRMKFDGTQIERLNDKYSYGMFLYDEYLYYMKSAANDPNTMSVYRSALDGSNEESIFPNGMSPLVYKNQLYYFDNQGNMFRTSPDGTDPQVLLTATVKIYVLSGEKIVYLDLSDNIHVCELDGSNDTVVRSKASASISNVNSYNGKIFFAEYGDFDYTYNGYNYTIKSCNMDGSNEQTVFSSVSYGIYMNIVNDGLMLMDYTAGSAAGSMKAVVKVMALDGSNQGELTR